MANPKEYKPLTRRSFLRRTATLVSSLGLGASVQTGLLDAIARRANKKFGTALAAEGDGGPDFALFRRWRSGFQFNSIFSTKSFAEVPQSQWRADMNTNYSQARLSENVFASGDGRNLYLAPVTGDDFTAGTGGRIGANPLGVHAAAITHIDSVDLSHGHAADFYVNGMTGDQVDPVFAHAKRFDANPAPVNALRWFPTSAVTYTGKAGYPGMTDVGGAEDFLALYKNVPMKFSFGELKFLLGEFELNSTKLNNPGAVTKLNNLWGNMVNLKGTEDYFSLHNTGSGLAQMSLDLDISNKLDTDEVFSSAQTKNGAPITVEQLKTAFQYNLDLGTLKSMAGRNVNAINIAMLYSLIGMGHPAGLLRTATLDIPTGDWHGNLSKNNMALGADAVTNRQGVWAYMMNISMAPFLDFAENILNPHKTDNSTIADSLFMADSSEFRRRNCTNANTNNQDGGEHAFTIYSKNSHGGTYGDVNPLNSFPDSTKYGDPRTVSFDPETGVDNAGAPMIPEADMYSTQLSLLGLDSTERAAAGSTGNLISSLIR